MKERLSPAHGRVRRAFEIARLAFILLAFVAAPAVGDIGSCGQTLQELDAPKFFSAKESIDCEKCQSCGIKTAACDRSCDFAPNQSSFPEDCLPLVHDGEVCLNALEASDCDDYRRFMSDLSPSVPTECNFCPPRPVAQGAGGGAGQGGAGGASADGLGGAF